MEEIIRNGKFKYFRIEQIKRDMHYKMSNNHFHSYYEIYYLLSGERYYFIGNRNNYVRSGDLVIVDSNQIHKTSDIGDLGHERILIEVEPALLKEMNSFFSDGFFESSLFSKPGVISLEPEEKKRVEDILYFIIDEAEKRNKGCEGLLKAKLMELFVLIIRMLDKKNMPSRYDSGKLKNHKIYEIADYISEHYTEPISLDRLSEKFYINKYYLCHIFKKTMSFTVNEYITTHRMMLAKKLLLETKKSIMQIAEALGFESATHFGKVFKDFMGKSPMKYRRSYKEKQGIS